MTSVERIQQKLEAIHSKRTSQKIFRNHCDRQEQRLARIGYFLGLPPEETSELIELILEFSVSAGMLKGKVTKLSKRIRSTGPSSFGRHHPNDDYLGPGYPKTIK